MNINPRHLLQNARTHAAKAVREIEELDLTESERRVVQVLLALTYVEGHGAGMNTMAEYMRDPE